MVLLNSVVSFAQKLPPLNVSSKQYQKMFFDLGVVVDARRYLFLVVLLALVGMLLIPFFNVLAAFMLFLALFVYLLPRFELESLKRSIESEIPIFLRNLGSLMNMGLPFNTAVRASLREGKLKDQFSYVLRQIERGVSVNKALQDFSEKLGTETTKRAIAQIISAYGHGGGGELKRLGDELLNSQKHKLKEYAAKSSMIALFFIMFSVVAPTFYIVASAIGSGFASSKLSFEESVFVLDIMVPAVSLVLSIFGVMSFPSVIFSRKSLNISTLPMAVFLSLLFFLPIEMIYRFAAFVLLFIFSVKHFLGQFLESRRIDRLEQGLADALLLVSSLPKGAHLKDVFLSICKNSKEELSRQFCIAHKQLSRGMSISSVLDDLKRRVNSDIFRRTIDVMGYAFKSGRNVTERISELAEDLLAFMELKREQVSLLSIQKYSLLLGVLLVPFVLSSTFSIVGGLEGLDTSYLNPIKESVVPAYLILLSAVVTVFVTTLEGSKSSQYLYFPILAMLSLFIYFNLRISIGA